MTRRESPLLALAGLALLTACSQLGGSAFTPSEPTVPFEVTSRNPAPGKGGVPTTAMVSIGFSAPVDPASVDLGSLTLNGSSAGRLEVSATSLRFYPAGTLVPGTSYEVRVASGVRSIDGQVLGPTPTWGFKTAGVAPTPDTVLAVRPRP